MATQTQMITGVDFVTIPTTDYEAAKEFYGETLGLEFNKPWGDRPAGEWKTGDVVIAVMQSDAFGQEFSPNSVPVAFRVDDVAASRKELEDKGVEFLMDTMDSGVCHMAYFKDPDGNVLLLHNRYAPPDARPGDSP